MKRFLLPLSASFTFVLICASILASPVDVNIRPSSQAGQPQSVMKFILTITNNQDFQDSFQIVFSGSRLEWLVPGLIAKGVAARSSESLDVVFYPTGSSAGSEEFSVSVQSIRNPEVASTTFFSISISSGISITEFKASPEGNSVSFDLGLSSQEKREIKGIFTLEDASGNKIADMPFSEAVSGSSKISRDLPLSGPLTSGQYTAKAAIEGAETAKYSFYVPPSRRIVQTVEEVSQGFTKEVKIAITNEGNVIERGYSFQQAIPMDAVTGMLTRPGENCKDEEGAMVCNFYINELRPGSTAHVIYSVNYWPAFNGYILLTVIMSGLIIYSFLRVTSPRIIKRHHTKGEKTHSISIHVKNPFFHNLKDVTVRDWVSPLAQVLQEEIVSTVPVTRKAGEGTELIWKLGDMKPKEERILEYKVRLLAEGRLRMPSAHLKFSSSKGEKKVKLKSNAITLG